MQANLYGETSNRTCNPCASNCSACTSPTGCTNCKTVTINSTSIKLLNFAGVCVNTCPTNSIPKLTDFKCDKCLYNCTSCDTDTTNCTTCITNFNLYRDTTTTVGECLNNYCPTGFYPKNSICTKCDVSCTVCDAENYCTECLYVTGTPASQYYFVNYQCKLTCPEKYYPDNSNSSRIFCRNCPSNCL